jgi:uncharacterized protein (TIGR00369 family)
MSAMNSSMETGFTAPNPEFERRCRDSFGRQKFMDLLGARMARLAPGFCEVVCPVRPELTQQHRFVHGGVLASLADSAAGYAAFSLMPADASPLTVEYKLNILRPGEGEMLVARARVVKPGRTLTVVSADVFGVTNGVEAQCVASLQTLMTLAGRPDTPRAGAAAGAG